MLLAWNKKTQKSLIVSLLIFGAFLAILLPNISSAADNFVGTTLEKFLWVVVNAFFGWMVWVGGLVLNLGINTFVIGFGELYASQGLGQTIDSLWVVVRDIFNLTFIFGLVFIGLKMILKSDDSGNRKLLISLIMAALLVNFSLFITKFVVDFSNIATYQLVKPFIPEGKTVADVSGTFLDLMGIPSIYSYGIDTGVDFSKMTNGAGIGYIFGTMVLFIISAFVFLGGGLLLMIRFVALSIYMILSPLMFIGWVFPGTASVTASYWKGFLSRAFFAPAYILMLYLAHRVLTTFSVTADNQSLSTIFTEEGKNSFSTVVPPFILTSIFLIAAIVVAQKMSANGGAAVISAQNAMMNRVKKGVQNTARNMGGAATYPVRAGGRSLTNSAGRRLTNSFNDVQAKAVARGSAPGASLGAKTFAGFMTTNGVDKNVRQATGAMRGAQFGTGVTNDTKAVYQSKLMSSAKGRANVGEMAELNDLTELDELTTKMGAGPLNKSDSNRLATLEKKRPYLESKRTYLQDKRNQLISSVTDLSNAQMEEMTDDMLASVAPNLTNSQVESFMKSDKAGDSAKKAISDARKAAITKTVGETGAIVTKELAKLTLDQIETMGDQWVRENVHLFTKPQMDELKKSKKFNENQRNSYATERTNKHKAAAATGVTADILPLFQHSDGSARKPEDIANLGSDVLKKPEAMKLLSTADLEAIAAKDTLNPTDRKFIYDEIMKSSFISPNKVDIVKYFGSPKGSRNWG